MPIYRSPRFHSGSVPIPVLAATSFFAGLADDLAAAPRPALTAGFDLDAGLLDAGLLDAGLPDVGLAAAFLALAALDGGADLVGLRRAEEAREVIGWVTCCSNVYPDQRGLRLR